MGSAAKHAGSNMKLVDLKSFKSGREPNSKISQLQDTQSKIQSTIEAAQTNEFWGAAAPAKKKKAGGGGGIAMEEVAQHNSKDDCWVVVAGQVLNCTKFLSEHPGGELAILTFAGKDATEEFNMIHPPDVISKYAPDTIIGKLGEDAEGIVPEHVRKRSEAAANRTDVHAPCGCSTLPSAGKSPMPAEGEVAVEDESHGSVDSPGCWLCNKRNLLIIGGQFAGLSCILIP